MGTVDYKGRILGEGDIILRRDQGHSGTGQILGIVSLYTQNIYSPDVNYDFCISLVALVWRDLESEAFGLSEFRYLVRKTGSCCVPCVKLYRSEGFPRDSQDSL